MKIEGKPARSGAGWGVVLAVVTLLVLVVICAAVAA